MSYEVQDAQVDDHLDEAPLYVRPPIPQARRWHHPEGPARRFLSHLLTFPLTLATGLREVGLGVPPDHKAYSGAHPNHAKNSTGAADGHSITIACIGARAESSLPPEFWRETLFALPTIYSLDLHHIGPEVSHPSRLVPPTGSRSATPPSPGNPLARVDLDGRTVHISWTRALLGRESSMCVDPGDSSETREETAATAAAELAVAKSDAVVLFNPGLGHPHLRKGWEGALKCLLHTGKPLIVTCHSRTDLDRDVRHLHDFAQRWCVDWVAGRGSEVFPRENPFRSMITAEDPLSGSHGSAPEIVSSNWGMFVIPRGAKRSE